MKRVGNHRSSHNQSDLLLFYQVSPGNTSTAPHPLSWRPRHKGSSKEHSTIEHYGFEYRNLTILHIKMRAGLGDLWGSPISNNLWFWVQHFSNLLGSRLSQPAHVSHRFLVWGLGCRVAGSNYRPLCWIHCLPPGIPLGVRLADCMH